MSDGLVSVSTESTGAAVAQAEAYDLELLGGVVSASIVSRTATGTTKGTRYRGTVLDLVVGEREIGEVKGTKTLRLRRRHGRGQQGRRGPAARADRGLRGLPGRHDGGRRRRVRHARGGRRREPTATASPEPTAEPTATPPPPSRRRRRGRASAAPSYRKRLMSNRFVFPVGGRTTIGGPFGSFRQIGAHQGNDLFADFGTPVVAVADGTLENVGSLPISGNRLWV